MTIKRTQGMPDRRLEEVIKSVLKTYLCESEGNDWLTIWTDLKDYVGAKSNGVNSAYKSSELPDGSTYTIRIATHPANPFNIEAHDEDTDYILSIVVTDDFSRNDQRYEPMTDEWNGRWQVVILSDDYDEQSVKRGIDRFLQCGDGAPWFAYNVPFLCLKTIYRKKKTL